MSTLAISEMGQVTLGADVLEHLGVQPGDKIEVRKLANGKLEIAAGKPGGDISLAFGMLKREGQRTLTIEEMNQIIADGWAGKL